MAKKKFAQVKIRSLVKGYGGCFATDLITVDGQKVGYMYREVPDNRYDSGWRFMAGHESQEYMDNPDNLGFYDVNTIANYDPEIVEFLDAPVGAHFVRWPPGSPLGPEPTAPQSPGGSPPPRPS